MRSSGGKILAGLLVTALVLHAGCAGVSRERALAYFLDDVDQPRPPQRRLREDLKRDISDLNREVVSLRQELEAVRNAARAPRGTKTALPIERAGSWPDAAALLPKHQDGEVDWVRALADGAIAPRSGIAPNAAGQAMLDLDVALGAVLKVKFSHRAHTEVLSCASCHPALFEAKRGSNATTMAKMRAGESCGACHGKVAFGVEGQCARCHAGAITATAQAAWKPTDKPRTPVEKARTWSAAQRLLPRSGREPDWAQALADGVIAPRDGADPTAPERPALPMTVELSRSAGPTFKAVFRHRTHTAILGCESCHPAPFKMARGTNPITMAKIQAGESCGACHGKVAFGVEGQCTRCHAGGTTAEAVWKPAEKPRTPIEKARTWPAVKKLLPAAGDQPDWARALTDGVIAPRAGVDPATAERPALPVEVELSASAGPTFKSVFRHQTHTAILGCESCHPAPFKMARGTNPITMANIRAGEFCGACHGKVAFGVEGQCARCHAGGTTVQAAWKPTDEPRTPVEKARTWPAAQKLLPVAGDQPDWARALTDGVIAPRAGVDPTAAERPALPVEVELSASAGPAFKAVFRHQTHTAVLGCESCHPVPFKMARGTNPITMANIRAGESCGACHGKVAFGVEGQCARCHAGVVTAEAPWKPAAEPRTPIEKAHTWPAAQQLLPAAGDQPDWARALTDGVIAPRAGVDPAAAERPALPVEVELSASAGPAFKAVFRHQTHTAILGCESCHPAPFKMARGTNPITMASIRAGESCGACHGKVAFGVEGQCARCHAGVVTAEATWKPADEPRTPIEKARTWPEAQKLLPAAGDQPDWARALTDGVIAPRAGIDPGAAQRPALPVEVELFASAGPAFKAVFRHQPHTAVLGCESCHPALFKMAKGTNPITMASIRAGESCGACHGKVAFGVEGQCTRCHAGGTTARTRWNPTDKPRTPIEKARTWPEAQKLLPAVGDQPDWARALSDGIIAPRAGVDPAAAERPALPVEVELSASGSPAFKSVFRHQTHTAILGCESCHPALFKMARGADPINMAKIRAGEYCGACHGKVAFGANECRRCHAAMTGG